MSEHSLDTPLLVQEDGATTPEAAETAAGPDSPATAPEEPFAGYGDFGFGDEAQIDQGCDDYKYYSELFHKIGLSGAQAHELLKGHRDYATAQLAAREEREAAELADYRARVRQELVAECGGEAAFRAFGQTALRGFRACAGGAGLAQADVDGIVAVMGDDPRFVKIFHHIGQLHQEDVLATGPGSGREQSFDDMLRGMFNTRQA